MTLTGSLTEKTRLSSVMSIYARILNTRVNHFARVLHQDPVLGSSAMGERLDRLLVRATGGDFSRLDRCAVTRGFPEDY